MKDMRSPEPDIQTATNWWCELPAKWTPFGWKDHLFRFNVLYNGMISAVPDLNPRSKAWKGQGVQLGVFPSERVDFPGHVADPQDNGSVIQGWRDCAAPVLWSEWAMDGLLLRESVFAHIPGGEAVQTRVEPLFAWIRLSIHDTIPGLPLPEDFGFNLNINAPYIRVGAMSIRYNIAVCREDSAYPRGLSAESDHYDLRDGLRILEADGKVRLGVAPGHQGTVQVLPRKPTQRDFLIHLGLEVRKGASVDVLLPMLPAERDVFDKELKLGYETALGQANRFWGEISSTAAKFASAEEPINRAILANLKLSEIISERDPASGEYALLTGSWAYADIWATPASMNCAMLLDTMGYHAVAEKYLKMYVDAQGTVLPQGDFFKPHPGSLGPPKRVAATVWTSDHGALLWALAKHALVAEPSEFIDSIIGPIVKACDFVRAMRRTPGHRGVPRLIPPGVATDMPTKIQSVWADAWNHKGLRTAVRLLKRVGHPRADEFESEADDYRRVFQSALRKAAAKMPVWTDKEGTEHRIVPMAVFGAQPFEYRNAFYLDTGPLILVFAGLLDADDELMTSTLRWFREGPPARIYRYDSDCWQVPSLPHEMSSCEPCFSWNVFHSHQQKDRARYLEAMYSLFAGAFSRQTYTVCETRGGVTGVIGGHLPAYLARLAVVDDQIIENELHLLRIMPLAWLREDRESVFENMPTEFGPVTLRASVAGNGEELRVTYHPQFRRKPSRTVLHIPPLPGLERVLLNEEKMDWDASGDHLEI